MNTPAEIALNYISVAQSKTSQKWWRTLILAVLAGAFVALGAAVATVVAGGYSGTEAALIKGAVFPVGLILVVICGAELFTGNCLLFAPLLSRHIKVTPVLKCLGLAYIGNLIGSVLIALLVVFSNSYSAAALEACISTALAKCTANFGECLLKGILCNILVCLAVWGAMSSKTAAGKILAVYLPVFVFVACGFEHSVANMYYLSAGLFGAAQQGATYSGLNVGNALLYCLLPSTLGNIVGGALIAVAYSAVYVKRTEK